MRIALDARFLDSRKDSTYNNGGIALYTDMLVRQLLEVSSSLELLLLTAPGRSSPISDSQRVREVVFNAPAQSITTLFFLSRKINSYAVDLFHSPFSILPLGIKCKTVTTIHDLMWLDSPELCSETLFRRVTNSSYYRLGMTNALKNSDHILTVSDTVKSAVQAHIPTRGDVTTTTHNALNPYFGPVDPESATSRSEQFVPAKTPFVLLVGLGAPYKNHVRAIKAFIKVFKDRKDWKLVLVRRYLSNSPEMTRLLEAPDVKQRMVLLAKVDRETLRDLYNRAEVLLFPSLYEGFGLPILEAMACSCPVVTSAGGAPLEVSGDAAVHVDPCSIDSIADGLSNMIFDTKLREHKIEQGIERLNHFSWSETARKTLEIYQQVCDH